MPVTENITITADEVRNGTRLVRIPKMLLSAGPATAKWVNEADTRSARVVSFDTKEDKETGAFKTVLKVHRSYLDANNKWQDEADGKTYRLVLHPKAEVVKTETRLTDDEARAQRVAEAHRILADLSTSTSRTLVDLMAKMNGEDGLPDPRRFIYEAEWSLVEKVVVAQERADAVATVENIIARQEAGTLGGDIIDAIEKVEADAESEGRRLVGREVGSQSTNGWANAVQHAKGVALLNIGAGGLFRYASLYEVTKRQRAAALALSVGETDGWLAV